MFTTKPILAAFNLDYIIILEVDSSRYYVGGVLSQVNNEGLLRPCAYFSKKMNTAKCNYEIYNKELLIVVKYLEE